MTDPEIKIHMLEGTEKRPYTTFDPFASDIVDPLDVEVDLHLHFTCPENHTLLAELNALMAKFIEARGPLAGFYCPAEGRVGGCRYEGQRKCVGAVCKGMEDET